MNFVVKYLSHLIFAVALGYFAFLAFVLEQNQTVNEMIMVVIAGIWILWIFAKSLLKMIAAALVVGGILFAGYYVLHAEEIACKNSGREWNKELKVCEDKKTFVEKAQGYLRKWVKENIKIEKKETEEFE